MTVNESASGIAPSSPSGGEPASRTYSPAQATHDASDEHRQLSALLQKLEQSENLSLDELDAVILQADAAYKNRLVRLERTRQMIDQLGKPPAGP